MLAAKSNLAFWIAVIAQIVNSGILIFVGDQFIYLKRLKKVDVSENLLVELKKIYCQTLLSYLFLWWVFIFGYLFNTPFLEYSERIHFLQTNATLLIFFFLITAFTDRKNKQTIEVELFNPKVFQQKLLRYNLISFFLTLGAYMHILITQ